MSHRETQLRLSSAKKFCKAFGIPADAIEPLRLRFNSLFLVPTARAVLRVHNAQVARKDVRREVEIARHLSRSGVPTPAVFDEIDEIYWSGHHHVTAWVYLEPGPAPQNPEVPFGQLIRSFHIAMESFPAPLPPFNPLGSARKRLDGLQITSRSMEFIINAINKCSAELARGAESDPPQPVHGDAHTGNVIWHGGIGHLIDFEAVAKGPLGVDIAPMVVIKRRFRQDLDVERFIAAAAPGFHLNDLNPALVRARELSMLTWLGQSTVSTPELAAEFELRVETLMENDITTAWTPQ